MTRYEQYASTEHEQEQENMHARSSRSGKKHKGLNGGPIVVVARLEGVFEGLIAAIICKFLTSKCAFELWCCNKNTRNIVMREIAPRVCWNWDDVQILPQDLKLHIKCIKGVNVNDYGTIDRELPMGLKKLSFGDRFNSRIPPLPPTVVEIKFGRDFNQELIQMPEMLKSLSFGTHFNQVLVHGALPKSLTHLSLGWKFNMPIGAGVLPSSLTFFDAGFIFNQEIGVGVLPKGLKTLLMPSFNQEIEIGVLPEGLKTLFMPSFTQPLVHGVLPPGLLELDFGKLDYSNSQMLRYRLYERTSTKEKKTCMANAKNSKISKICGERVLKGKVVCSYHARHLKCARK